MLGRIVAIAATLAAPGPGQPPAPINPPPIINAPCPDLLSSACLLGDTIYIDRTEFADWGRDAAYGYRLTRRHEYGHVMDLRRLTDRERTEFSRFVGLPDLPWSDPDPADINRAGDYPQEVFADDYARCRFRRTEWPGFSERRVCPVIVRLLRDL